MDTQTLLFAKKLTGAWQTADKEMTWFFDEPDELKYPHWTCQVKYSLFDNFDKHNFFLERVSTIYRLHLFDTWMGKVLYVLNFIDNDNLEIKTLIENKPTSLVLQRVNDVISLFEVKN